MKRKRTGEPANSAPADPAAASGSESDVDALETGPPLDSFDEDLAQPIEALNAAVNSATAFLQPSEQLSAVARAAARALYSYATSTSAANAPADRPAAAASLAMLPELHVEGFDAEQVWLQLDMASAQLVRRAKRLLKKAGPEPSLLTPETEEDLSDLLTGADLDGGEDADSDLSHPDESASGDSLSGASEDAEQEDEDAATDDIATAKGNHKRREDKKLLPTEDKFLRLDDLESFLEDAERTAAAEDNPDQDLDAEDRLGSDLDDSEAEDERDLVLGGEDIENDSDADLDALLEDANRLVGRPASTGRKRAKTGKGRHMARGSAADDEEEGEGAEYMYDDFWGPSGKTQTSRKRGHADEAEEEDQELDLDDPDLLNDEADSEENLEDADEDLDAEEDPDQTQEDPDDDGMGIFRQGLDQSSHPTEAAVAPSSDLLDEGGPSADVDATAGMSKHERQQARMQERIARLEAQNMAEKDWFMQGEAGAAKRPLNSALELDLDFERQIRPPPQPTEEATASLEDLIRDRIANHMFDDPPRVLPPEPEKAKVALEMDDKKSHKGLGELYEEEFVAATTAGASTAVDKHDAVRREARVLMKELFGKLDALSHFQYAPKPVIEEMQVRADVPALAMEEVAPQVASEAAMRAPEEVYKGQQQGAPKAAEELSREERTRLRAKKKRAGKKRKLHQDDEKTRRLDSNIIGQKSETALVAAAGKKGKKARAAADVPASQDAMMKYSKSGSVFKRMQEQKEAAAAGILPLAGSANDGHVTRKATNLKL
ncbi:hypothetical protein ABBQ38_015168 [Trebouxia sp. C0009 RCD-2024]